MKFLGVIFFVCLAPLAEPARILGVFPIPSVSHQVVHRQIMLALHKRGHEVVIVTPDPIPDPPENYTQIDIGPLSYKLFKSEFDFAQMVGKNRPHPITLISNMMDFFCDLSDIQLNISEFKSLIHSEQHFDVMFLEWLISPVYLGFAHKFKVPVIGISSLGFGITGYDSVASPTHPAYLPDLMTGSFQDLTFWERLNSAFSEVHYRYKYYFSHLQCQDALSKKYFGPETPFVGDMERNVSLLMSNTHYTTNIIRPLVPAIVEFGGPPVHLTEVKPLPKDLQEFLDNAKEGVIYFSLGSNVKSSTMPEAKRAMFLNAFRRIKQKVLWKWETDDLPGKPDNVKIHKWLPQTAVLAHANVKAFITQTGLQSMGEATHFEKPMIVIPFFADQDQNAKKLESVGVAVRVDFETMTEEILVSAINDVLNDPKYKKTMVKYSALTRDQPQPPLERAVWWTEYVLRHKGARHLRSQALDLPWYQYLLLDILAFVIVVTSIALFCVYAVSRLILNVITGRYKMKVD